MINLPLNDPRFYQVLDAIAAEEDMADILASPSRFRSHLLIDIGKGRRVPLGAVSEPYQAQDFAALDSGWRASIAGEGTPQYLRAYLERPRGHSKTTDIAAMASWALLAAKRKVRGVCAAGARKQAKFLRDAIDGMARLNPWLGERLKIHNWLVINEATGSTLDILASDDETSYGETPDFVILDELTHWKSQDLWTALFSSVAKVPNCMLVVIANAGHGKGVSWQWKIREECRTNDRWYFHRLDGPCAKWVTEAALEEQRKLLLPKEYARLWLNLWQTSAGDALDMDQVYKSVVLPGPAFAQTLQGAVAGLDFALTQHHAAFVILGLDIHRRKLVLQYAKRWRPQDYPNGKISLMDVEAEVVRNCQRLGVLGLAYDPWQAASTAERLEVMHGIPCFKYDFTPKNLQEMATTVLEVFKTGQLELYTEQSLIDDLARMNIVKKLLGYKIEAPDDPELGHCDLAMALAIALPWAVGSLNDYIAAA